MVAVIDTIKSIFLILFRDLAVAKAVEDNLTVTRSETSVQLLVAKVQEIMRILVKGQSNTFHASYKMYQSSTYSKSTLYALLNEGVIDWSSLYLQVASQYALSLLGNNVTAENACLVVDKTLIKRESSKQVDLQSLQYDVEDDAFHLGFTLISIGLYLPSANLYIPLTYQVLAGGNNNNKVKGTKHSFDVSTKLGSYIKRSRMSKSEALMQLLQDVKNAGITTNKIAMSSWLVQPKHLIQLSNAGYQVVGLQSNNATKYYDVETNCIVSVRSLCSSVSKNIAAGQEVGQVAAVRHVNAVTTTGKVMANLILCKNWDDNKAQEQPYIGIISNDCNLDPEQVISDFRKLWQAEEGYRALKSDFGLEAGNQSRNITSNLALISLCHLRFLFVLAAQHNLFKDKKFSEVMDLLSKDVD